MIDIHSHVLFGLDDGPNSIDGSLAIASQAADNGVTTICATPHLPWDKRNIFFKLAKARLKELKQVAEESLPELEICLGFELSLDYSVLAEKDISCFTLNEKGKYLLCELPFGLSCIATEEIMYRLCLDGFVPILAHFERSTYIAKDQSRLEKLIDMGVLLQVNAGSIGGKQVDAKIQTTIEKFLRSDLIKIVASDAHNTTSRNYGVVKSAFLKCCKIIGKERALDLFVNNPALILEGKKVETIEFS